MFSTRAVCFSISSFLICLVSFVVLFIHSIHSFSFHCFQFQFASFCLIFFFPRFHIHSSVHIFRNVRKLFIRRGQHWAIGMFGGQNLNANCIRIGNVDFGSWKFGFFFPPVGSLPISIFCLMNIYYCWFWTSFRHHHYVIVTFSYG